jgi:hypothetical protein
MMGIWIRFLGRIRANARTVVRRRRLALLIVAIMLPMTFATAHVQGVYYSRADVLFLPPQALVGGNLLQADPTQTLSFAAMVEHKVNAEHRSAAPRTTSAPLYGTGAKNTHAVYIPSSGGQWQLSFSRPVITVEVVSDSSEGASRSLALLVARITELASLTQDAEGIPGASQITTELSPAVPSVTYIDVRNSRATVTLALLTLGMASGVPILAERVQTVRRAARRKAL